MLLFKQVTQTFGHPLPLFQREVSPECLDKNQYYRKYKYLQFILLRNERILSPGE